MATKRVEPAARAPNAFTPSASSSPLLCVRRVSIPPSDCGRRLEHGSLRPVEGGVSSTFHQTREGACTRGTTGVRASARFAEARSESRHLPNCSRQPSSSSMPTLSQRDSTLVVPLVGLRQDDPRSLRKRCSTSGLCTIAESGWSRSPILVRHQEQGSPAAFRPRFSACSAARNCRLGTLLVVPLPPTSTLPSADGQEAEFERRRGPLLSGRKCSASMK